MLERKVIYCNANVAASYDPTKEATQKAIITNTLKMKCPKIGQVVELDSRALLGTIIFNCRNSACKFHSLHTEEGLDKTATS